MSRRQTYLLNQLPDSHGEGSSIQLGYGFSSTRRIFRLKSESGRYYLKKERKSEKEISEAQFHNKWKKTQSRRLIFKRYILSCPLGQMKVDQYLGAKAGLIIGRYYPAKKKSKKRYRPEWAEWDVSYDPRFKNRNLAQMRKSELHHLLKPDFQIIGTIPYISRKNSVEVVLITSRQGRQWIFPKGQIEKKMTPPEVALMEAREEAGIIGRITAEPIRIPFYKGNKTLHLMAYPIEVDKLKKKWLEKDERRRKTLSLEDAEDISSQPAVHYGLEYLRDLLF